VVGAGYEPALDAAITVPTATSRGFLARFFGG